MYINWQVNLVVKLYLHLEVHTGISLGLHFHTSVY